MSSALSVRLVMNIPDAEDGGDAVRNYVENLIARGIRDWVFRVESADEELVGYYDGYGRTIDLDQLVAAQEQMRAAEAGAPADDDLSDVAGVLADALGISLPELTVENVELPQDNSDEGLLALAEELSAKE